MPWRWRCSSASTRAARPPETGRSGTLAQVKNATRLVFCLLLALPLLGQATPETVVRVEVIVFQHVDGRPDRWPARSEDALTPLPDPLESARLAAWTARLEPRQSRLDPPAADDRLPAAPDRPADGIVQSPTGAPEPGAIAARATRPPFQGPTWPDFYVALPDHSPTMQRAARRLTDSARHRVLTSVAWLQPLDRLSATLPVRVRGTEPLWIDWTETVPTGVTVEGPVAPPAAVPAIRYRLDGSVQVRQRQFRHVDLDLVWSEYAPIGELTPESLHDLRVHRLNLSRPIRLDRLEYFDSPWLGVLVLVEEWQGWAPDSPGQASGAP